MTTSPGAALLLTAAEAGGLVALDAIFSDQSPQRFLLWQATADAEGATPQIGRLFPEVVVDEEHWDELEITEHPVEQGAAITDHAYKRPALLSIRAAWSNSWQFSDPAQTGAPTSGGRFSPATGIAPNFGNPDYLNSLYSTLLDLQETRQLFSIQTGRRPYNNMLLRTLQVRTDEKTANVLMIHAKCQQLVIVNTQVLTLPPLSSQARPQRTAADEAQGTKQPFQRGATGSWDPPSSPSPNPFQAGGGTFQGAGTSGSWDEGAPFTTTGTGLGALP